MKNNKKENQKNNRRIILSLLLVMPLEMLVYQTASIINGAGFWQSGANVPMVVTLLSLVLSFAPHEWLHCAGWNWAEKRRYVVNVTYQLPFSASSHFCGEMPARTFLVGALLPFAVLSIIPCAAGIATGCIYPVVFGMIHMTGCCTDILLGVQTIPYLKGGKVSDMPGQAGVVFARN